MEVVPFGEMVWYRLPEIAVEERWAKGVWLGHARHSSEALVGTDKGVVKAWAIRRMADGQQGDGDMVRNSRDPPLIGNWMQVRTASW